MWYKSGTITVTNGSTTVTGSGTQFIANVAIGEALYAPDGRLYEITNVASDTAFTISPAYLGATAAGQNYTIVPSQSYIRDLAAQAADLVNNYSTIANFAGQGKFSDGTVSAPGIRFSDDLDTGIYRIGSNNLGIAAGGTKIVDVTTSGISVTGTINGTTIPTSKTLVDLDSAQTLTNKTLTSPAINTPTISGGTINNTPIGGTTPNTGAFTNLSYTGTLTGGTGVINIGSGQLYKDASGNLGIGTSTPITRLDVVGSGNVARFDTSSAGGLLLSRVNAVGNGSTHFSLNFVNSDSTVGEIQTINRTGGATSTGTGYELRTSTFGSAGFLSYFTNGSERARITSDGNVGIGTSSPSVPLSVLTSSGTWEIVQIQNGLAGASAIYRAISGAGGAVDIGAAGDAASTMFFRTNSVERMRIDASGNVGIGTSSPNYNFVDIAVGVNGTNTSAFNTLVGGVGAATFNSGAGYTSLVDSRANTVLVLGAGGSERMRIDASGNLLVGTTSETPGIGNTITGVRVGGAGVILASINNSDAATFNRNDSDGAIVVFRRQGNQVGSISVTTTATAYNTSSDYRLKNIEGALTNSGEYIDSLKPVQGTWKADGSKFIGLLAHEAQEVSQTQVATGEKDGEEMQAMDYGNPEFIANIIAELQSLRARVAQLEGN